MLTVIGALMLGLTGVAPISGIALMAELNRAGEGALEALESLRVEAPALAVRVELL